MSYSDCVYGTYDGVQVEVYNLGMLLQSTRAAVLHRGQEVPGRFTIPAPHDKVCAVVCL